jgi:hypothetical protein
MPSAAKATPVASRSSPLDVHFGQQRPGLDALMKAVGRREIHFEYDHFTLISPQERRRTDAQIERDTPDLVLGHDGPPSPDEGEHRFFIISVVVIATDFASLVAWDC